jgi:hypothetical protein
MRYFIVSQYDKKSVDVVAPGALAACILEPIV